MPIPGPAPKPAGQKRRRNKDTFATTKIPAAGLGDGPLPEWPSGILARKPPKAMVAIWESLWAKPQAYIWDRQHLHDIVARYVVNRYLLTKNPSLSLKDATELRMMEDRLGLNSAAMLKLRWEIEDAEQEEPGRPLASVTSISRRVAAVDDTSTDDDEELEDDDLDLD